VANENENCFCQRTTTEFMNNSNESDILHQMLTFKVVTCKTLNEIRKRRGTAVAQWLRQCATNQKLAGSIPNGVIGIFP